MSRCQPDGAVDTLVRVLGAARDRRLVVITGAGISLASGIPTFRGSDPDAIWKRDVTELGTLRYFQEDPVGSWHWYTSRFDHVLDKRPNAAHRALVELEAWQEAGGGDFLLVTQNVDTLHEDAGTRRLIKVHGSADRARCTRAGCEYGAPAGFIARADVDLQPFLDEPGPDTLPRCPACGALLRQHVLWFDEFYDGHRDYRWQEVITAARTMDVALFVGTSFAVGVTELFLQAAIQRGVPALVVDPGVRSAPYEEVQLLSARAEELLPAVCARIRDKPPGSDRSQPDG